MSEDPSGFRLLSTGPRLTLPPRTYRLVSPGSRLPEEGLSRLADLAARDGAAAFLEDFGEDEWLPGALLRVPEAWLVLEAGSDRLGVAAVRSEKHGCFFVALATDDSRYMDEEWACAPELTTAEVRREEASGHFFGEGWRLSPHPRSRSDLRDWSWAWGGNSLGPVFLALLLREPSVDVAGWLATQEPLPYRRGAEEYLSTPPLHGEGRLYVGGDRLVFLRSYHRVSDAVRAVDAGLCAAVAEGALGAIAWDVLEQDYGAYMATGESAASLREYLDPASDETVLRGRWDALFAPREIVITGASTHDDVAAQLGEALGLEGVRTLADLERALAAAPFSALPRSVGVWLPFELDERQRSEWLVDVVARARDRLRWSVGFSRRKA